MRIVIIIFQLIIKFIRIMLDPIPLDNPYAKIYQKCNFKEINTSATKQDVQSVIRHLGFMYNTFGQAIKDFISIVSCKFQKNTADINTTKPKFITKKNSKQSKQSKSRSNSNNSDNRSTQNNRKKKPQLNQQKQKEPFNAMKKLLYPIKEYPRAANHQEFDSEFMNIQDMNSSYKLARNSTAEKQQNANLSNLNNLNRFHSQFVKMDPPERLQISKDFQFKSKDRLLDQQRPTNQEPMIIIDDESFLNESSDFINNINQEDLIQPEEDNSVRIQGGRKKKDREKLSGVSCMQCDQYYKAMQISGENYCECTSRHRTNLPKRKIKQQFTQQFDLE